MKINPSIEHLISEINKLSVKVGSLEKKVSSLEKENRELKEENGILRRENDELRKDNDRLKRENEGLKKMLERALLLKNSNNSHIPPSLDMRRKNKSLRGKSGKKRGGQSGHKGHTLEMTGNPDQTKDYSPGFCKACGSDLQDIPGQSIESRQSVELPPITPIIVQHNIYRKVCTCGCINEGSFPGDVKAPVSYGSSVSGLAAYLHTREYIPYQRMKELFRDVTGINLSIGTLRNMVHSTAKKATGIYEEIKKRLQNSSVVGADETSIKAEGAKGWMWTWQNRSLTFITYSNNRGYRTIEDHFKDGLPDSILVHDRYAAHFKTNAAGHQICLVHLRRDLKYLEDLYKGKVGWVKGIQKIIKKSCDLKSKMSPEDYLRPCEQRESLERELSKLMAQSIPPEYAEAISLQKSLRKHQSSILTFLYHVEVPPDNNGSERAIRNIKVKQKISGLFRSEQGAQDFAVLRSITDTVIKSGQNILEALTLIGRGVPE